MFRRLFRRSASNAALCVAESEWLKAKQGKRIPRFSRWRWLFP